MLLSAWTEYDGISFFGGSAVHRAAGGDYFPHVNANSIARFASSNRCEVEGAMDVRVDV